MRDENVRTFSALGPVSVSAASAARGCKDVRDISLVNAAMGDSFGPKNMASKAGDSRFDGKEVSSNAGRPNARASASPFPATSRALRPRAVSTADRWTCERSPSKKMAVNQRLILRGCETISAIMLWRRHSWN